MARKKIVHPYLTVSKDILVDKNMLEERIENLSQGELVIINNEQGVCITTLNNNGLISSFDSSNVIDDKINKVSEQFNELSGMYDAIGAAASAETAAKGYVNTEIGKLSGVYASKSVVETLIGEDSGKTARSIATEEVVKIVSGAPEAFDTLKEIAEWIGDGSGTTATQIVTDIENLKTADSAITINLNGKVDKVEGKGLSTNDYTTDEKNKLTSVATIINDMPIVKGDADNSAVLKGGNNQVISEGGVALGKDNFVGLKGWYYKAVQIGNESNVVYLYLTTEQQIPILVSTVNAVENQEKDININISKGDICSIINGNRLIDCFEFRLDEISNYGRISFTYKGEGTNPLSTIQNVEELKLEDYSVFCISKPSCGIVDLSKCNIALGNNTKSLAESSVSIGLRSTAVGITSYAEGQDTIAVGECSHAEGAFTKSNGIASHTEGFGTQTEGLSAHAEGYNTLASGGASHSEGSATKATGLHSHAEGDTTEASGEQSHAEGKQTIAEGEHSHSEGYWTKAHGKSSHVEGQGLNNTTYSVASGDYSHSEGFYTRAFGTGSHTEGTYTIAYNKGEHAEGIYNKSTENVTLHSVGIGTSNTDRKNAHEITTNGKHYILGIGNYDGTKLDGATDVATVINNKADKSDIPTIPAAALKYCGITTTKLIDGDTTNSVVINGKNHTAEAGCVVFYEDTENGKTTTKEFVFNGTKWELLGSDITYKVVQDKVSSPTAVGSATSFIDTISQDENGVISVTKKNVNIPTPDWNAQEGEAGYIENRTHYKNVEIFENGGLKTNDDGEPISPNYIRFRNEYGNLSDLILVDDYTDGSRIEGTSLYDEYGDSVEYIYGTLIFQPYNWTIVFYPENDGIYYVDSVYESFKQLDEKFIPDTIARKDDMSISLNTHDGQLYLLGTTAKESSTVDEMYVSEIDVYMENGELFALSDETYKVFGDKVKIDFEKLNSIPKVYYTWKDGLDEKPQIGTSAQKLREIYPEAVSEVDGKLAVSYHKLSIIALAAIDELHKENEELKTRLKAIEDKLGL